MSKFRRVITPTAKHSLKKLPREVRQDIISATKILETEPFAGKKLSGVLHFLCSFHFKSQNVSYRVAYTIDLQKKLIVIHFAHTRENFYEKLRRIFR